MTRKQKFLFFALLAVIATVLGRIYLNSPIAHIQFAGETIGNDIFGKWNITNSIIASWAAMGVIIVLAFLATRKMRVVPRGLQNFVEAVVGWLLGLAESVAGPKNGRRFFPLVATIFIFIVVANWTSLVPVFGTIGKFESVEHVIEREIEDIVSDLNDELPEGAAYYPEHYEEHERPPQPIVDVLARDAGDDRLVIFNGESGAKIIPIGYGTPKEIRLGEYWDFAAWEPRHGVVQSGDDTVDLDGKSVGILAPYLRSMNTDLMNPLAIALIAMFMVEYWGIRANGFRRYMSRFFTLKGGPIGAFVGILEGISEVAKVISFSFRLLGNMFAGEVLIFAFLFLMPIMAGVFLLPFVLETFVGFIQAVIFAALTLIFATLATESHEGHEEGAADH